MLPLSFLRHRVRTVAVACAGLMGFVFYGTLFVMSLYFQQLRGLSPGAAGIALLPLTISSTVGRSSCTARCRAATATPPCWWPDSPAAVPAQRCSGSGPGAPYLVALAGLLLTGGASTIAFSALTSLLMAATPADQAGLGSGLQNTTRQAGALIAVSVLGSLLNTSCSPGACRPRSSSSVSPTQAGSPWPWRRGKSVAEPK